MIAPYFLPRRRVGSLRPFKFAIHLRDFGWEPHIITIASDGKLTAKEQRLLQDIPIYTLNPPFDRTNRSGSQQQKSSSENDQNSSSIADWIDRNFPVDTWLPFFRLKYGRIKRIARKVNPDALWSTGDPWSAHWVGKKLSAMLPDLFWMADFRDPWTLSETDLKQRSSFASVIDQEIEHSWIRKASVLCFTTDRTRQLYENNYADLNLNTTTIYNTFDRALFNEEEDRSVQLNFVDEKLNLVFFGRFRRLSPARPVADILHLIKQQNPSAAEKIDVHSFGSLSESDRRYLKQKNIEANFVIQDPVPVELGLQVLDQADILLLSTDPEREYIIPAKLWDYLSANRPILSVAPNPEVGTIIEQTKTGIHYNWQKRKIVADLLTKCVSAKEEGKPLPIPFAPDQQKINQFSAKSATQKLVTTIEQHYG